MGAVQRLTGMMPGSVADGTPVPTTEVATERLSDYLDAKGIDRVALLKIDVEGAEPLVLAGARPHLERGAVRALLLELDAKHLANFGYTAEDVWRATTPYGYWPYDVANLRQRLSLADLTAITVPNLVFLQSPLTP
jgi:Methyltransferase FkbM domain